MNQKYKDILLHYLPSGTIEQIIALLMSHPINVKITRNRNSKLGDYRPPGRERKHTITINGGLGPHLFYLVFLHEYAHLLVWNKYGSSVSPHGKQWKEEFSSLLKSSIYQQYMPQPLHQPILSFALRIKATFASDAHLWKTIKELDGNTHEITVEQLPEDSLFIAANGKTFKKEQKLKTRYRCYCINNSRRYLFHPQAVIIPVG